MTPLQHRVYAYIGSFWKRRGYAPSYREIQEALGLKSVSSVHRLIVALIERGYVTVRPHRRRSVMIVKPQEKPQEKHGEKGGTTTPGGDA